MDPERWRRVDRLFVAALELGKEERERFLARECGEDEELRRQVESLLAHDRPDSFLEDGAAATEAARLVVGRAAEDLVGSRLGRFEVEARIGAGGMGEVYRARDPLLGRAVALKLIPPHLRGDPERQRRFRHEAMAASALNHPNIVTVHEIVEHDDGDLMVTELVEGQSLRARLDEGPLALDEALDIGAQIARGLAAAHAAGLVHRDVKPENVMLRADGLVKILDFGIAKDLRGAARAELASTLAGTVLGTVAYMSPEQASGQPVDARTDVWSLGVVLHEMLVGATPPQSDPPPAAPSTAPPGAEDAPSRRRPLPPAIDRLLARALARDRAERPDAATLGLELERLRARGPGGTTLLRAPGKVAALALLALTAAFGMWRFVGSGTTARIDSIAVLPLENAAGDPQLDYLSDGVTESLIQGLAQAGDLRVVSRASAFRFKGRPVSTTLEIGRELGVRSVLTGRMENRGDRLSVSVELVDTSDDSHLWGHRYELPMSELTSLYQTISADVLTRLHRRLSGDEEARIARLHTDDVEAYRLYLEGRYYWNKSSPSDYERSREAFERALDVDPDYALAWAGLGNYYGYAAAAGLADPTDYWPRAERAAKRALELDPTLPQVRPTQAALVFYWRREWSVGADLMRAAVETFPESAIHFSTILARLGRLEESQVYQQMAFDREPASARLHRLAAASSYLARSHETAVSLCRRALELDPSDLPCWETLGDASLELERDDEAVAAWARVLRLTGRPERATELEATFRSRGIDAALAIFARSRLDDLLARRDRGDYVPAYFLARESLRAGLRGEAIGWIETAFTERNRLVLDLLTDPVFDALRDEPVYRAGAESLGLPAGSPPPGHPARDGA
jgi:serine/threonine-protein kinase